MRCMPRYEPHNEITNTGLQVMVDAITNARDAQRFMHTAQQAAKDARLSYDLTQRSIAEIGRLVKESGPAMDLSTFRRLQSD